LKRILHRLLHHLIWSSLHWHFRNDILCFISNKAKPSRMSHNRTDNNTFCFRPYAYNIENLYIYLCCYVEWKSFTFSSHLKLNSYENNLAWRGSLIFIRFTDCFSVFHIVQKLKLTLLFMIHIHKSRNLLNCMSQLYTT
jgi:hypothetical protein